MVVQTTTSKFESNIVVKLFVNTYTKTKERHETI